MLLTVPGGLLKVKMLMASQEVTQVIALTVDDHKVNFISLFQSWWGFQEADQ